MKRALLAGLVAALMSLGLALPAGAAEVPGPPYGRCNATIASASRAAYSGGTAFTVACQFDPAKGQPSQVIFGVRYALIGVSETSYASLSCGVGSLTYPAAGQFRCAGTFGDYAQYGANFTASDSYCAQMTFPAPYYGIDCAKADATVVGPGPAVMPTDNYPGGVASTQNISRPAYDCQRTYDAATGTVSVSATGPSGLPAGATSGAVLTEKWSIPWIDDGASTTPKVATVTVPTGGRPAGGWVLTFTSVMQLTAPNYAFTPAQKDAVGAYLPYLRDVYEWFSAGGNQGVSSVAGNSVLTAAVYLETQTVTPRLPTNRYVGTADADKILQVYVDGSTNAVYGYWPRLAASEAERSPWVLIGTSTGTSLRPAPNGFGSLVRIPVPGAAYSDTTTTTTTVMCQVLLDVSRPSIGGTATTTAPPSSTGPTSGGSCTAGPLGNLPLVGGLLDATAGLACAIGDIIGRLLTGLKAVFLPPANLDWGSATSGISTEFPFSIIAGLGTASSSVTTWATSATGGDSGCAGLDLNSTLTGIANRPVGGVAFRLPTPSDSGCPGMGNPARTSIDNQAGDLWGYRVWARSIVLLFLWIILGRRIVRAWSPAGAEGEAMIG